MGTRYFVGLGIGLAVAAAVGCGDDSEHGGVLDAGSAGTIEDAGPTGTDAGAAGTGGTSGGMAGGVGSDAGGSGGQAGGAVPSDHAACTPATQAYADDYRHLDPVSPDCEAFGFTADSETRIPNPTGIAFAQEVPLEAPLGAGTAAAVSLRLDRSSRGAFELWGGHGEACGPVDELLWWTEIESRLICGEFTPSRDITRLVFVWRKLGRTVHFLFGVDDISICAQGSCPDETGGHGLEPGGQLTAPLGLYSVSWGHSLPWTLGINWEISDYGNILARYEGPRDDQFARPLAGIVRMPPHDPFGDGWYCLGQGSTHTRIPRMGVQDERSSLELRNLTRLPSCEAGAGTASITVANDPDYAGGTAEVSSDNTDFAMTGADLTGRCANTRCEFQLVVGDDPSTVRISQLYIDVEGDVGSRSEPTLQEAPITSATWIYVPPSGPMRIACVAGGSIYYDPNDQTSIALEGISEAVACPGETVEPDSLDVRFD